MTTSFVDQVHAVRVAFDRRFTFDQLRRVDPELHERFALQQDLWIEVYFAEAAGIAEHGPAMVRAWAAVKVSMEQEPAAGSDGDRSRGRHTCLVRIPGAVRARLRLDDIGGCTSRA